MIASPLRTEAWPRVTRKNPCPVCEKTDWCEVSPDGAIVACNRVKEGSYRTVTTALGEWHYHRLRDDRPYTPPAPKAPKAPSAFDTLAAGAVYAFAAEHCAAELPAEALGELVRRFGPVYGPQAVEAFGIGYCDGPALVDALEAAGRRRDAIAAGVLRPNGREVVKSLAGRLVIPHRRGGGVGDLRGSGIKGQNDTKELSLPGTYADRGVDGLFFNHPALDALQPGEDLHLAGGAWKTIALHLAGLVALGTRGESELSEAQIAAIAERAPGRIIVHIDSENPKEGQELSAGRRLVLPKAERLATIAQVFIAEPPRETGAPKVDPDSLLRDYGPGLVRAYADSAIPLAAFRVALGVDVVGVPAAVAEENQELRRQVKEFQVLPSALARFERNQDIPKVVKPVAKAVTFLYHQMVGSGKVEADGYAPMTRAAIAENYGGSVDSAGDGLKRLDGMGVGIHKRVEHRSQRRIGEGGQVTIEREKVLLVKVDNTIVDELVLLSNYRKPEPATGEQPQHEWGGTRTNACPKCAGTETKKTVETALVRTTTVACADCGHVHDKTTKIIGETETLVSFHTADDKMIDLALMRGKRTEAASVEPAPVVVPPPDGSYPPGTLSYEYQRPPLAERTGPGQACGDCGEPVYAVAGKLLLCLPCRLERERQALLGGDVAVGGGG